MKRMVAAVLSGILASVTSYGAVIIADEGTGWNDYAVGSGTPGSGWTTVLTSNGTGVDFSGPATGASVYDDLIVEGTQFAGNLAAQGVTSAVFTFTNPSGGAYTPDWLYLYFDDGTYDWIYQLTPPSSGPSTYSVLFDYNFGGGWSELNNLAGATEFASALTTVSALGINIGYEQNQALTQAYSISGFTLNGIDGGIPPGAVPEPGTYVVLSTALMSLGFTYARRRREKKA